jgi:hypothetical protein
MKKKKRLTKRERKELEGKKGGAPRHIHCIACGRHLDPGEFTASPVTAKHITGNPVQVAQAWH